jgi:two-component system sensor histidine kinase/response regulator
MNFNLDQKNGDILVVDDRLENAALLFNILSENGYEVRQVINGKQAINAAYYDPPDLILLDIMMPDLNGYEVCQKLKESDKTAQIPIIFLSALDMEDDKVKAFEMGGVDYITKPFQVREVLARVEHQLTIQRQQQIIADQNQKLIQQNQDLQELNDRLLEANQELEQFSYIVSHDLQSPLQSTIGFARLLEKKYHHVLDIKANHYIDRIIEGSNRMNRLISDLLSYSRIQTRGTAFELIDLNEILEDVQVSLNWTIEQNQAEIICQSPLPKVMGDETQLQQLFQNLIGNGIKFNRPNVPIKIKIVLQELSNSVSPIFQHTDNCAGEALHQPPESQEFVQVLERPVENLPKQAWLIGIQDNGIGIPDREFDKIFQIFQRLHTNQEYPGTGIGLTICKKIVERHGGNLWLTSEMGVGTTFYFTLPFVEG